MTTTALLCVARNERPFTEEWLEYHLGLGFDRVYYVSTDVDFASIQDFFAGSPWQSRVVLTHFDALSRGWQDRCYNQHLPSIREDWVLPLDVDEFVYLHRWSSIQEYLSSIPVAVNQIQFPWLNLISSEYGHDRTFDLVKRSTPRLSDHVKSIVRVRDVRRLGVHAHTLHNPETRLSSGREVKPSSRHSFLLEGSSHLEHPLILHFCSRGHMDALIRIVEQGFHNQKCGSGERDRLRSYLRESPTWGNLPTRYMLMQLWSSMPRADVPLRLLHLTSRTDVRDLKTTFAASMQRLLGFDGAIDDVVERFEARFQLARKIRAQNQMARFVVSDYLGYRTQLGYIEAQRKTWQAIETKRSSRRSTSSELSPTAQKPVFIHISKNAGSSIVSSCGVGIVNAGHRTAASWVKEHGDDSPLFAILRNPFDRVVSEYFYRKRRYDAGDTNAHLANLHRPFEDWVLATFRDGEMRTRAFFEGAGIPLNERNMIGDCLLWFVPQTTWLGDGQGRLLVRELLRYENLRWDWSHFAAKYSLEDGLARRNVSKRIRDYRPYYSAVTRDLIADYYQEDLEAFGYAFDALDTRSPSCRVRGRAPHTRHDAGIVNANEMRVTGLARSGTHAIIHWIGANFEGQNVLFINNVALGRNPYAAGGTRPQDRLIFNGFDVDFALEKKGLFARKDCLIFNVESASLESVRNSTFEAKREEWLGKSANRFEVLVVRDAFNFLASWARSFLDKERFVGKPARRVELNLKSKLPRWIDLWKNHAREFLGITQTLGEETVKISYNAWCTDEQYRAETARKLGLGTEDKGFRRVLHFGRGSSFDGQEFDGRAEEMQTSERWKELQTIDAYRGIFADSELVELSEAIFGEIPGTDALLT